MHVLMIMPFDVKFNDVYGACERAVEKAKASPNSLETHPRADQLQRIELYRVDNGHGAVAIMDDLLKRMKESSLCIADISGNNPNVLWELGYAMALEKPVIIISQDVETAPFDVSTFRMLTYDRAKLEESLVNHLARQIAGVFRDLPEVLALPEEFGFARTLAMSMASPAYFLDAEFNIRYMNEAAVALFLADKGQSAGEWIGRSLVSFINEFSDRLLNLTEIEKNLQSQKEALWRSGKSLPAKPLNVERVVLDTCRYGIVEMQKTGIAVRNVNDNRITGWVVSFNCINSREPGRFEQFHENHKAILESQILCQSSAKAPVSDVSISVDDRPKWIDFSWTEAKFHWARSYAEKQASFEYMVRIMTTDESRYGLQSVKYLSDDFFDYKNTEYLQITVDGVIKGLLRLHMKHNLLAYPDLVSDISVALKDGQGFADAGIYLPIGTPPEWRLQLLGRLLGSAVEHAEAYGVTNIYAQVLQKLLARYQEFGFSKAGNEFTCEGWQGTWIPIWVKNWNFILVESVIANRFHTEFQQARARSESELII